MATVFERLSSGSRINRASDDAAGLSVAMSLNVKTRIHSQAIRNVSDAASYLNVADGATGELKNVLIRLRELSTQASNGSLSDTQRQSLDKEAQALQDEYNRVIETAIFNGVSVLGEASLAVQGGVGEGAVLTVGTSRVVTEVRGDGTFQAPQSFQAGAGTYSAIAVDVNGDGLLDIVTSAQTADRADVLLGNGDGTFQARRSFVAGDLPRAAIAVDLNGDGRPDLLTAEGGSVSVLRGNGDGTFQARSSFVSGTSYSLIARDINGDGKTDILTQDYTNDTLIVLAGNGDGTFQARMSYGAGATPYQPVATDVDNDGLTDIVLTNLFGNTMSVLLCNSNGTFQARKSFATLSTPFGIGASDFDGDGNVDVVTGAIGARPGISLGNGDGTFKEATPFGTTGSYADFNSEDINNDGY